MAFSSYDGILAALGAGDGQEIFFQKTAPAAQTTGKVSSSWFYTGNPAPHTAYTGIASATAGGFASMTNLSVGAMPFVSPTTVSAEHLYITAAGAMASTGLLGTLMLIDRIAETGLLTPTTAAPVTTVAGITAWERYTDGIGVMAFLETKDVAATATASAVLTYTNTASTAGRVTSAAVVPATNAYMAMGTGTSPFFALQGGDLGIKSIESMTVTVSNLTAGAALVVCKPLLVLPCTTAYYYTERDLVIQTPKFSKMITGAGDKSACLQWLFLPNAATTPTLIGSIAAVQG